NGDGQGELPRGGRGDRPDHGTLRVIESGSDGGPGVDGAACHGHGLPGRDGGVLNGGGELQRGGVIPVPGAGGVERETVGVGGEVHGGAGGEAGARRVGGRDGGRIAHQQDGRDRSEGGARDLGHGRGD